MKKVLVVVDYQNDFVSGTLGNEAARKIEQPIVRKIEEALKDKTSLIFTFDTHQTNYLTTEEGTHLPVEHCVENTDGWQLYGEVRKYQDRGILIKKETFGAIDLTSHLQEEAYDQVELIGVVSNICVLSNAVLAKAALPQAKIYVDAQCVASNDEVLQEKAFDLLENLHITVTNRKK